MLFNGPNGKTLVSDEFNQMCIDNHVEASVQAYPNPGNLHGAMRLITFRNFDAVTVKVVRSNNKVELIPSKGTLQVMLAPEEPLPTLERMED
jgi:hypothetical protein